MRRNEPAALTSTRSPVMAVSAGRWPLPAPGVRATRPSSTISSAPRAPGAAGPARAVDLRALDAGIHVGRADGQRAPDLAQEVDRSRVSSTIPLPGPGGAQIRPTVSLSSRKGVSASST